MMHGNTKFKFKFYFVARNDYRPAEDPERYFEIDTFLKICKYLKLLYRTSVRSTVPLIAMVIGATFNDN